MRARLVALFAPPRGYYAAAILAMAVLAPSLSMGLFVDDYLHVLSMETDITPGSPLDLFLFADGDEDTMRGFIEEGPLPWFVWPSIVLHFFRPLSSLTMVIDHALFGRFVELYHLQSILWYGALVLAAGLVFRRVLPPWTGVLAAVLFALDEAHIIPAAWWSNRNAIVAATPALFGLWAHLRWREDGWRLGLPLSLACFALGLLGGETALGIMPFVGAYEIFWRRDRPAKRFGALLLPFVLSVAYLGWYKWNGYGVDGSGIYLDPIGEWREFLWHAPGRFVMVHANQFLLLPIEAPVVASWTEGPVMAVCAVVMLGVAGGLALSWPKLRRRDRRALAFLLAGAALSSVPALATFPSGRLMTLPSLGSAALLAYALRYLVKRRPDVRWARAGTAALVAVHAAIPLLAWVTLPPLFRFIDWRVTHAIERAEFPREDLDGYVIVAVNPPDPFAAMYTPILRVYDGVMEGKRFYFLSMAPFAHEVTRVDERTLELRVVDGEMLTTLFERLVRNRAHPIVPGERFRFSDMTVHVLDVGDFGPRRVRFEFRRNLDDPKMWLMVWEEGRFVRYTPPPVGESELLERTRGLMNLEFLLTGR